MKRFILILIFLLGGIAFARSPSRIIKWICNQNFTRTQLQNFTWQQLEAMAENRDIDPNSIKPYRHTIKNAAWSDWRQRRIETARTVLETKVHEYNVDAIVVYMGQQRSTVDPNNVVSVFSVEIDLELGR